MPFDGEEFGKNIVAAVNASIERQLEPVMRRLDALESIGIPRDGKDVDMDAVRSMIVEECRDVRAGLESTIGPELQELISVQIVEAIGKAVEAIPAPKDGKDAADIDMDAVRSMIVEAMPAAPELPDIAGMVDEAVSKAVEAIPAPKDGTSVTLDDIRPLIDEAVKAIELPSAPEITVPELPDIAGMITEAVKAIPIPPAPELPDIAGMIDEAVKAIPVPRDGADGKSVTLDDVKPLIDDAVSKAVKAIPAPKDGRDGVDAVEPLINADGHLIFTMSDGRVRNVGRVVGKDGDDGVDCDIDGVWKILNEKLAALPPPKDGADGLGFDDLNVEYDGERTIKFVMTRGDQRKEFEFAVPVVLDRGVYVEGKSYARGDSVTWAGSTWIAQTADATEKPGVTAKQWRLAVKKGRDGRDGVLTVPRENKPVRL